MTDKLTRAQLRKILKTIRAIADIDKATRNAIVCALVGHSRIQRRENRAYHCMRCGKPARTTDVLVIVNHATDCRDCRANYAVFTWRDTLYVRDPFKEGM